MAVDLGVFDKVKTFDDYNRLEQEFQLKKMLAQQSVKTGAIDAASKANIYATQVLSGAVAGGQPTYDQARQKLASMGIDVSGYDNNPEIAGQQLQAARLAQSPLGSLLNAGLKNQSNAIALAGVTGEIPEAAYAPLIPGLTTNTPAPRGIATPKPQVKNTMTQSDQNAAINDLYGDSPVAQPVVLSGAANDVPIQQPAPSPQATTYALPSKNPGETQAAYNQRLSNDPNVQANLELVKKTASKTADVNVDRQGGYTKAQSALQGFEQKTNLVTTTIDKALATIKKPGSMATNYGQAFSKLPNTDARALNNYLDTIKANVGFDQLQSMRDNSPTGGALGQVSEMENRLLQAVNGALDPLQGDQLQANLENIKVLYPQVLAEKQRAFAQDYGGFQPIGNNTQPPPAKPSNLYDKADADFKAKKIATPDEIAEYKRSKGLK